MLTPLAAAVNGSATDRVLTAKQDLGPQLDTLEQLGCVRVFHGTASGSLRDRPELARASRADSPALVLASMSAPGSHDRTLPRSLTACPP